MKLSNLKEVEKLALELMGLIEVSVNLQNNAPLRKAYSWEKNVGEMVHPKAVFIENDWLEGGKGAAAIKRKSMDLTRALARMRNE